MMPDNYDAFSTTVQPAQSEHDCGAITLPTLHNIGVCARLCLHKVTRTVLRVPAYNFTLQQKQQQKKKRPLLVYVRVYLRL